MAKVGILGGSFNPPHLGHLICAQEAARRIGLDAVVLMPVHQPPHKPLHDDPGVEHRVEMCRLAAAGDERLRVSRLEADRPGPSYTVETLRRLREEQPGDELVFVLGADVAVHLGEWREPEAVVKLARLAVADRDGLGEARLRERLAAVDGAAERAVFFPMPRVDISSSLVRARVAAGEPIRYLVPDAVAGYIEAEGLYR